MGLDSARFRHQSKRDFLCLFNSVEQLYTFLLAELSNDWDRTDEILKSASLFEAVRLGKTIRVRQVNGCTGEVSTVRHAYNTNDWWLSAPGMMARAMSARF